MRSEEEVRRALDSYGDMVWRVCMVHLKNRDDAQDILQNVLLKFAQHTRPFQSPEHEKAWVLRVAINTGGSGYPYTYYDFVTEEPQGVDIEFIKHFAAEYGYTIEWFDSSWDACSLAIANGEVDVFVYAISSYYAGEVEAMGTCLHSDSYFDLDLVLVTQEET